MDTEPVHINVVEDEEVDDEDEDLSDDYTGTEEQEEESSDDDFEFKDLEKEIYGRLGGPPPELKEAMEKVVVIDPKENKSSKNKEENQSIKEEANNLKSSTLRETPIPDSEKAMTDKPEKQTKEVVAPPKAISTEPPPAMETDVVSTTEISNVSTSHENDQIKPKNTDKVECAKTKEDEEAPMDDCGCIVM